MMKCGVYNNDGTILLHTVELVPQCTGHADLFAVESAKRELMEGKDVCNKCGDCIKCHEGHVCRGGGEHQWCQFDEERDEEHALPKPKGKLYRIVYSYSQAKPTFIHFRADSESAAIIAFFGELMNPLIPIHVASVSVDNEYTGPIIGEDFELPKEKR